MGHDIRVLAGEVAVLRRLSGADGEPVRLFVPRPVATIGVAPVSIHMEDNVAGWYGPIGQFEARELVGIDILLGERASVGGAIAYLETNYHGGYGYQGAALWRDGALVFGLDVEMPQPAPPPPPPRGLLDRLLGRALPPQPAPAPPGPVSRALAGLGIAADPGGDDAFFAFGLGLVSSNEDFALRWIELPPPE